MCFSAPVSFTAGAVLCATGVFALSKTTKREQIPLAMIPLIFGIQQICEGILWLTMNNKIPAGWTDPTALIFLVFALVIWPIWTPMAMLVAEPHPPRRKILWGMLICGAALAVYHGWGLTAFPVKVDVCGRHIDYIRQLPQGPAPLVATIYIIITIFPPFVSSSRNIRILGVATLLSFLFAAFFYREYIISVWCLFGAIISAFVAYVIVQWNAIPQDESGRIKDSSGQMS